jgi:hypothetical protein
MMMVVMMAAVMMVMVVMMPPPPHAVVMMVMMPPPAMMMVTAHERKADVRLHLGLSRVDGLDRLQQRDRVGNGIEQLGERGRRRKARWVRADDGGLGGVERCQAGNRADNADDPLVHMHLLGLDSPARS